MIDNGFNQNLIRYTNEQLLKNKTNRKEKKKELIDSNSFFGSYERICKERANAFDTNPFFSNIKNHPSILSLKQSSYNKKNNHQDSFFGAFINHGTSFSYGIPSMKYRLDPFDFTFEAEYKKYLNQFPANTSTKFREDKDEIMENTQIKTLGKKTNRDIFTQSFFNDNFNDTKYNTSQLLKSQHQFTKKDEDFYTLNQLDETGFINVYKCLHYELSLQQSNQTFISRLEPPIDQQALYSDLIYLLQGIPSKTFKSSMKYPFTFEFSDNNIRLVTSSVLLTQNIMNYFIEFGTKMQLIQYLLKTFLFNHNNILDNSNNIGASGNIPFILKRFYSMVNDIIIQITEKIIHYKTKLINNQLTLIGLQNKIALLYPLINILYSIFNFNQKANFAYENSLDHYFLYYIKVNIYQKSHHLINSLLNFYYSFQNKSKTYFLIKNLLVNSLHSYLFFIIILIFNNTVIDSNNEYFILKSGNNANSIGIDQSKIPVFLNEYKSVILNNAILLEYIKRNDDNYFLVCNYKSDEFIAYLDQLNLVNYDNTIIHDFIKFKESVFNKKLELMYAVNEKIINAVELKKNEEKMQRLNQIKLIKESYSIMEKKEEEYKKEVKAKKMKLLNDMQEQIMNKKQRIEFELQKIKNEQIEQKEYEKEQKRLQQEILQVLKAKYEKIRQSTKMLELYGDEREQWKIKRHNNTLLRNDLFNAMYDRRGFDNVYPIIDINRLNDANYHLPNPLHYNQNEESNIIDINTNNPLNDTVNNNKNILNINDITISIENEGNMNSVIQPEKLINEATKPIETNPNIINQVAFEERKIDLPKFFIHSMIYNDIVQPVIDTALDIANEKYKNILKYNEENSKKLIHFVTKNNKEVDLEVVEVMNQISVLLKENNKSSNNNDVDKPSNSEMKMEIPIQVIIQEFFYDVILNQYKITNHCFVQMLKSKYSLHSYFDFFREIFLCHSGDLILRYIESIFDFRTLALKSNDGSYLQKHLQTEIEQKYSNKSCEYSRLGKYITFNRLTQMNLNFSITNIEMAFKLMFNSEEPINFLLTNKLMEIYDGVFKQLLKHFIYNQIIVRTYTVIKNIRKEYPNKKDGILFRNISKMFNDCYKTLKIIQTFLYYEIIDQHWRDMKEKVTYSADIYEISTLHNDFIQKIADILIDHPLIKLVNKLYHHCSRFYLKSIVADYFDFDSIKNDSVFIGIMKKMKKINHQILKYINEERIIGEFYDLKAYFA